MNPIAHAPTKIKKAGYTDAHSRPLVSEGKQPTLPFISFRTKPEKAWAFNQIELNPANSYSVLVFDLDTGNAHERVASLAVWEQKIAVPHCLTVRKENGHAHAVYFLRQPVQRNPESRPKPIKLLSIISDYFAEVLGADPGFRGQLIHNPCKRNPQFNTVWMETRKVGYTLKEDLAPFVPLDFKLKPRMPLTEPSRNCWVHRHTCKWQYRNQGSDPLDYAVSMNESLDYPMEYAEVLAIVRSVRRWAHKITEQGKWYTAAQASEHGRRGGVLSGAIRRSKVQERDEKIVELAAQGWSQRAIAKQFGLTRQGVAYLLQSRGGK